MKGRLPEPFPSWAADSTGLGDCWIWAARERAESDMTQLALRM